MYIENTYPGYKQIAVSRNRVLRPVLTGDETTTHQMIELHDFVIMKAHGKKLEVFQYKGRQGLHPVINKQIKNKYLSLVSESVELTQWFKSKEPNFPEGFLWTGDDVLNNPDKIIKHYSLNLLLSEVPQEDKIKVIHEFSSIETKNQFTIFDTKKYVKAMNVKKKTKVSIKKDKVKRIFDCLPEQYGQYIVDQQKGDYFDVPISSDMNWRAAKKMPSNVAMGVLYHNKELLRFSDVIAVFEDDTVDLVSMVNVADLIEPVDENFFLFTYKVEKEVKRLIYVIHTVDQATGAISSDWRLYAKR